MSKELTGPPEPELEFLEDHSPETQKILDMVDKNERHTISLITPELRLSLHEDTL